MDFAVAADHEVKIKEDEKRDKYLDLARELKKLLKMIVMVIRTVTGTIGMVPKDLESIGNWKTNWKYPK